MTTWKYELAYLGKDEVTHVVEGEVEAARINDAITAAARASRARLADDGGPYAITAMRLVSVKRSQSPTPSASAG